MRLGIPPKNQARPSMYEGVGGKMSKITIIRKVLSTSR